VPGGNIKTETFSVHAKNCQYEMSSSYKCTGMLFQTRGPAAAKLLSPNVLCVHGTALVQSSILAGYQ